MPSETENCELVTVTDEEIKNCVRTVPHLDTLILVKAMVHRRTFSHPFRSKRKESVNLRKTASASDSLQLSERSRSMEIEHMLDKKSGKTVEAEMKNLSLRVKPAEAAVACGNGRSSSQRASSRF
ncbi:unnamed protein product [Gongylonema pulchrum]|uniref:NPH3 domain-containing protein n=1 Tax=Gongylonema pulchrum TaxID=637853 RepID=A0A183D4A6_9BILA|nr:unnamed protein product [Gongylonema pulchrum]